MQHYKMCLFSVHCCKFANLKIKLLLGLVLCLNNVHFFGKTLSIGSTVIFYKLDMHIMCIHHDITLMKSLKVRIIVEEFDNLVIMSEYVPI